MRLKKGYVTQNFQGRQLMVAVGGEAKRFHGLARSNETAAFIVDCLKTETTEEKIVEAMLSEYDADKETVRRDVRKILDRLRGIGAIEE